MAFKMRATRNISFTIKQGASAAVEYKAQVTDVNCAPTSTVVTWAGGDPNVTFSDLGPETWALSVTFGQDWNDAQSLARFLHAHHGEEATVTYSPNAASDAPDMTTTVTLVRSLIGGPVNAFNEATVSMPAAAPTFA